MNILIISHVYPGGGTPETYTPVVHYFTREWVKMGHRVIVVNLSTYFPLIYYHLPKFVLRWAVNHFGAALANKRLDKAIDFEYEDVPVARIPIYKSRPSQVVPYKKQDKQVDYIFGKLKDRDFTPDVIVGHWLNPIYLISRLKHHYNCATALVLHGIGGMEKYPRFEELAADIDLWGIRSASMVDDFKAKIGNDKRYFICSSGIPTEYVNEDADLKRWSDKYVYVGFLLDRKYPDVPMHVLRDVYGDSDFHYDIVGGGFKEPELHTIHESMGYDKRISIVGRKPRNEVMDYLDNADCFIMISRGEVFGLVYLEAMARGCIAVAGRGEGMTGIIEDGVNGFLCEPGNAEELKTVVKRIRNLSPSERETIRRNGMATAKQYTDYKCAERYVNELLNINSNIIKMKTTDIQIVNTGGGKMS